MLDTILLKIKKIIPEKLYTWAQPAYHQIMALLGALIYRFPSRKLTVIAVTGTKGKSSTTEILNAIFERAGYKTALTNTIRFKIGDISEDNLYKMSMPGRFFMQKFLRKAVTAGCSHAIIEMTSQGALFGRHKYITPAAVIVTNVSPEHIDAHGSFENYIENKIKIAKLLEKRGHRAQNQLGKNGQENVQTNNQNPSLVNALILNMDDSNHSPFLAVNSLQKIMFSVNQFSPYKLKENSIDFTYQKAPVTSPLSGLFNLSNIAAAITCAEIFGIGPAVIQSTIANFSGIRGRVEYVKTGPEQDFDVVVDYAHTPDSLEKFYQVFGEKRKICVLGGTGGGRDRAKRAVMGAIADQYCDEIILTNEDPYDEDPMQIINDVAGGIKESVPRIIVDRREAIAAAVRAAQTGDAVLITGKGTDPYIMGTNGTKIPWSDTVVARDEIQNKLPRKPVI